MKNTIILFALIIFSFNCAGGEEEFECTNKSPQGVWEVQFTYLSGSCGEVSDGLINFSDPDENTECRTTVTNSSNDQCTIQTSAYCTDAETYILEGVSHLEWLDEQYIKGKMSVSIETQYDSCNGLYEVEYFKL